MWRGADDDRLPSPTETGTMRGHIELTARDIMTKGVIWCRASDTAAHAAHLMEAKQVRRLPVIHDNKRMVGMLALGDISHATSYRIAAEIVKAVSAHHA
jgi:CBS-domain-containing membrane protein